MVSGLRRPYWSPVLILGLVCAANAHADLDGNSPVGCHANLVAAYTAGQLPADLATLCNPAGADALDWLSAIELGNETDVARYWDALEIARDIDHLPAPLRFDHAALAPLLAALDVRPALPSWPERLRNWLQGWLKRHPGADFDWLETLLERYAPPAWVFSLLFRIGAVLVLVTALYVVLREFDAQGWSLRRARGQRAPPVESRVPSAGRANGAAAPLSWDAVIASAPPERARLMLRWMLAMLSGRGVLPSEPSWTHGEQLAWLARTRPALGVQVAAIIVALEPCVFGARQGDPATLAAMAEQLPALERAS